MIARTLAALGTTLGNLKRPKVTEKLPWKADRAHPERYRASFALLHDEHGEERCIACGACAKICPSQIITVQMGERTVHPVTGKKRATARSFVLDMQACIFCEMCVQVCPSDAITMLRVYQHPVFEREDLVMTAEKLYANEKLGQRSWAIASRLAAMQDPARTVAAAAAGTETAAAEGAPPEPTEGRQA
jgi:NADH-quinone oxidoreductase subunit I